MESKEFRNADEVHNYLKEIGTLVDKNIQFCQLKRFNSDKIKLAAQKSEKKLQSKPADQEVEKAKLSNIANGLFCNNDPSSFFRFFLREEVLTQRGFRKMYDMPSGIFERKVWQTNEYRKRIKM